MKKIKTKKQEENAHRRAEVLSLQAIVCSSETHGKKGRTAMHSCVLGAGVGGEDSEVQSKHSMVGRSSLG